MSESASRTTGPTVSWSAVSRLIRLQNQTGTWLLLLPTMWSLVLAAEGLPPWRLILIFMVGSFLMRSAGVVLNDLADRSFDRQVARTRVRPLASGELGTTHAWFVVGLLLASAGLLVWQLNPRTILLSPVALFLAAVYPFAKRFIHLPQAMLGIAFGWGTIMAWTASRGTVEWPAWCLFAATVCWAIGYDTIYALQDRADDRRIGVKSSALWFGTRVKEAVGAVLLTMLLLLGVAGWLVRIGWGYYAMLAAVGLFFVWQVAGLRQDLAPGKAFALFQQHVWAGAAILAGTAIGFLG
jgi:4-hydroxybenzoate polyprenyltransferase